MVICCKCLEHSVILNGDLLQVFGTLCCFQWQYVASVWNTLLFSMAICCKCLEHSAVFNGDMLQVFGILCCFQLFRFSSTFNVYIWCTVELVLKTTSIKRPPLYNDHSQVRQSNIWWYLHCIENHLSNATKYLVHLYITTTI